MNGQRATKALTVMGVTAVLTIAWMSWRSPPDANSSLPGAGSPQVSLVGEEGPGTVVVHISGAVANPGLVVVADDARVADVVAAAGGLLPDAAGGGVNLAAGVVDGQHIHIHDEHDQTLRSGGASGSAGGGGGTVVVNAAAAEELASLPGVGPVLAERIVAHRERHGPFAAPEDLLSVAGIGEAKLSALRDHIVIP